APRIAARPCRNRPLPELEEGWLRMFRAAWVRGLPAVGVGANLRVRFTSLSPMSATVRFVFRLSAIAALALVLTFPHAAEAQSRRDREAMQGLEQRMAAAENRYREALVRARNNEPGA